MKLLWFIECILILQDSKKTKMKFMAMKSILTKYDFDIKILAHACFARRNFSKCFWRENSPHLNGCYLQTEFLKKLAHA